MNYQAYKKMNFIGFIFCHCGVCFLIGLWMPLYLFIISFILMWINFALMRYIKNVINFSQLFYITKNKFITEDEIKLLNEKEQNFIKFVFKNDCDPKMK